MISYMTFGKLVRAGGMDVNEDVMVTFQYDPEGDPLAISLLFEADFLPFVITWTFSRDLLVQAVDSPFIVGEGDVRLRNDGEDLLICLKSPDGHADLTTPIDEARQFLDEAAAEADRSSPDFEAAADEFLKEVLG